MFTVLGFSLGFLALGAVVAVINVVTMVFTIAFTVYASLALIGVVVFSVIGIRRVLDRRRSNQIQPSASLT
ncbi:hypothetical protein PT015_03765 [Candidatus Mycobacterium wuenschmannii]|uniref:Transmembrane protein n=1 Tax=Candidatus Mycobacterium wuenschmannii TaxID=3027808 RepID=A0ABY8VZ97_9MYCO|nr:hypothetical protein [Candidatus Mycobacterium wuenschmannii]WIM88621.1 hypothetical protein PT015_03765 [Candidatus Mycobacterium wuenschmannii]